MPDIQISDETEIRRRAKPGHHFELFEEIDGAGSFVEDQKVHPETIIKTHLVRKHPTAIDYHHVDKVVTKLKLQLSYELHGQI